MSITKLPTGTLQIIPVSRELATQLSEEQFLAWAASVLTRFALKKQTVCFSFIPSVLVTSLRYETCKELLEMLQSNTNNVATFYIGVNASGTI